MKKATRLIILLLLTINYSYLAESAPFRNVIYFGNWSVYSKFYPSLMDAKYITHINFSFLDMDSNGDLKLTDEYADFQMADFPELSGLSFGEPYAGVIGAFTALKLKNPHLKIGISVGGWSNSGDFPGVAADKKKRQNFANNIAKFLDYTGFDFVDIDWEHPTSNRKGDSHNEGCPGGPEDTENFTLLMKDLRKALDKIEEKNGKHYELSLAMSAEIELLEVIEYDKVLDIVDYASLMTYDLAGSWTSYTAHHTPLYTNDAYDHKTMNGKNSADSCIKYFKEKYGDTIDYTKILIGVAAYTRGWAGVKDDGLDEENPGLYATAKPNSVIGPDGDTDGSYGFNEFDKMIKKYDLIEYFDETAKAAYYYSPTKGYFFTGDNEKSVAAKGKYVKDKKLGGLIMWMASQDDENKLTKTMFKSMYGEDYQLPALELIYGLPEIEVKISVTDNGYDITIINHEESEETNEALKYAEALYKNVVNMKLYIKTKSEAEFSSGSGSGNVKNKKGIAIIDPSNNERARKIGPGSSYNFKVKVSGTPDINDIEEIKITQRITRSSEEFKEQNIALE